MDFSFLFDNGKGLNVRGLLAAIPLPLFLLLVYNLGVLLLVVIGTINPYGNGIINGLNVVVNITLFFYLGYKAARTHKLGLISFALAYVICFLALFFAVDYVSYYLYANNIGELGDVGSFYEDNLVHLPLPQIMHYNHEKNQIENAFYAIAYQTKILTGLAASMLFSFVGWIVGQRCGTVREVFKGILGSNKNRKGN